MFLPEINPLNTKLNPICHLLALLGAHRILHVSGVILIIILIINCKWAVAWWQWLQCVYINMN
jgi:hypothetical protein